MSPAEKQHQFRIGLNFALVYILWGSTYLAIRVVVEHIPPAMMGAVRFLVAGPVMLAYCALSGRKIGITRQDAFRLAVIGVLLLTGGNVLVAYAEKYVASGLAALIVAVVPIWVAIIEAWVLRSDRLSKMGVTGLVLGLVGLAVLLWPKLTATTALERMQLIGAMVLIVASLSWTIGSIFSRRWQVGVTPFAASAWEMTFAGVVNLMIALALGDFQTVEWTARGTGALIYLIIAGSWIGFTAYIWLLEHVPTAKVATYAYVNPVVAVALGWLILNEQVDGFMLAGTVIIVAAVVLVTRSKIKPGTRSRIPVREPVEAHAD